MSLLIQVKNKESALKESKKELKSYLNDLDLQNDSLQRQASELVVLYEEQNELRSKAERLEQEALHASRHDQLTNLSSRGYFTQICQNIILEESNKKSIFLFLDIDGFKSVNDTLGHGAGDELLVQIATRLKDNIRNSDIVARFGGDEFVIFLHDLPSVEQGEIIARKVVATLGHPYKLRAGEVSVGASCGLSIFPDHGTKIESLIDIADQAMYSVKLNGKNGISIAQVSS